MSTATMTAEPETTRTAAIEIDADRFDIRIHNVVVTAFNPKTGQHRTFSVETVLKDTNWGTERRPFLVKAGTRVAYLLTGDDRDDDSNWKRFGFVGHTGVIKVFGARKGKGGERSDWEKFAVMLSAPTRFKAIEWKLMGYCTRCNRPLTHPESIDSGMGPICRGKGF
jgi:hypothetical protein